MQKPTALNGLMLYVTDVQTSLDTYQNLGFDIVRAHPPLYGSVKLGEILIQFQDKTNPTDPAFQAEAMAEPKGGGLFVYLQVADVDRYYGDIQGRGVQPATAPRDWPGGNREFVVRDPDGYKLVFYQPHGAKNPDEHDHA